MIIRARTLMLAGVALLVPAVALADDDQPAPTSPPTEQPAPLPQEETPIPAPQPAQTVPAPTVIVNEPPPAQPVYAPMPTVEGEEVADAWNAPLFTTSAVMFAGSYGGSIIVAAGSNKIGDNHLYVPVVGPWLDLNDRSNCASADGRCDFGSSPKALLIIDGIVQGIAVLGIADSFLQPTHHKVETRTASLKVVPTATTSSAGFSVLGRF